MSSGGGGDPPPIQWRQIPRQQSSDPSQQSTTPSSNPIQQFQQGLNPQSQLQQSQFQQMQHQNIQGFTTPSSNPIQQFQQGLNPQSQLQQSQFQQMQQQNIQSQQFPSTNYEMMNSSSDFPDYNDPSATFDYGNMPFDTFDFGDMTFDVGNFGNTSYTPPSQAVMNVHPSQNYDPAHVTSTPVSNSLPLASNVVHNFYGYVNPYAAYRGQNPLHDYPNLNPHLPAMSINANPRLLASSSLNVARKSMSTKVGLTAEQKQELSSAMDEIGDLDSILAITKYAKLFADVDKSVLVERIREVEKKAQNKGKTPQDRLGQEQDDEKWHEVVVKNKRARVDHREESSILPVQEDDQLVSRNDIRSIVKKEVQDGVKANVTPKLDHIILLLTKSGDQS